MKFVMHREGKFAQILKSNRAEIAQEDFCESAVLAFPKNPVVNVIVVLGAECIPNGNKTYVVKLVGHN